MKTITLISLNCKMTIREPDFEKDGTRYGIPSYFVDDIEVEERVYRLALDTDSNVTTE